MKIKLPLFILAITLSATVFAQSEQADTVIVPLANTSKVIFIVQDRNDLEILKHYNFQDLFQDVIKRIELADTTRSTDTTSLVTASTEEVEENWTRDDEDDDDDSNDEDDNDDWHHNRSRIGRTWQSSNMDLGTNNFLSDGQFPDGSEDYAVRPWGSWYVALNSIQRTRLSRNFFIEWGLGVSWYNFKFERDNIRILKDDSGIQFLPDTSDVDFIKSKLSATYLQASFVPLLDFGDHSRKPRMWDGYGSDFRIGFGPYVAYRIASKSKVVYEENGEREKDKNRDSFYLNNLRYGMRLQLGFRSTDFFLNYDLNELFSSGKGPQVNAVSFGVIF
jgi:hypothetical protein